MENFLGISSGISGSITPGVSAEIPSKFLPMDSVRAFSRDSSMKFFTNFYRDSSSNHTKSRVQHKIPVKHRYLYIHKTSVVHFLARAGKIKDSARELL